MKACDVLESMLVKRQTLAERVAESVVAASNTR